MEFWTNKQRRTVIDDAEDLGSEPSGGPLMMWLAGVGIALIPLGYGVHCLLHRVTRAFSAAAFRIST